MKDLIFILSIYLFLSGKQALAQSGDYPENKFREYFTVIDTITIPDEYLIANIGHLSVWRDSLMVITDEFGGAWYRLDLNSGTVSDLNPEDCFPGFKSAPIAAYFLSDGKILVSSARDQQGYIFDSSGGCYEIADRSYVSGSPHHMVAGSDHKLYQISFSNARNEPSIIIRDSVGKKIDHFTVTGAEYPVFASRYEGGGITQTSDRRIWYSFSANTRIYEIDPEDRNITSTEPFKPGYIKPFIGNDFPEPVSPRTMMKFMMKLRADHSRNSYFGKLNDDILFTQMVQNEEGGFVYFIMLYDRKRGGFLKDMIKTENRILQSGNNLIYTYIPQEDSPNENPAIGILSWTGPASF